MKHKTSVEIGELSPRHQEEVPLESKMHLLLKFNIPIKPPASVY